MTRYTHRVVKRQRGLMGKWFSYPGKGYDSADEAVMAARAFAGEQCAAGVTATLVSVITRGGREILSLHLDDGILTEREWRT